MNTKINEAKALVKHISNNCKCKLDITACNSNKKCKREYSWHPSMCICDNSRYVKSIVDN